ncbi:diguanylate cyclase [uncultured Williamsia sp.]|uniref:GGDEF domain-containing protein n=1 Tax=uncultured Williamsia sp. TaxID=259311 RepID=UPI00260AC154|nr:GGDEF domain-containing protein [uncultured Williamsia sp.]
MRDWLSGVGGRFDQRSAAVLASTSGAVVLPIFPVAYPDMVRPGLMPWLILIWAYSALSMIATAVAGRLSDRLFVLLGAGGMVGVAGSAYVLADPGTSHAVLVLLAAIPALAAMHSRPAIVVGFVVIALSLALLVAAAVAPSWPEFAVAAGSTAMAVTIPTTLVAALRRSLMALVRRLETISDTDPLTGVLNRRGVEAQVHALMDGAVLGERGLGAAVVDIDHFKAVNDSLGHSAGDRVLVDVAEAVRASAPHGAIVARVGGEEFFLLAAVDDETEILAIAERTRIRVAGETSVTVSVGAVYAGVRQVSTSPLLPSMDPGRELIDMLSRSADAHLYASKAEGRDRVGIGSVDAVEWSPVQISRSRSRLMLSMRS